MKDNDPPEPNPQDRTIGTPEEEFKYFMDNVEPGIPRGTAYYEGLKVAFFSAMISTCQAYKQNLKLFQSNVSALRRLASIEETCAKFLIQGDENPTHG